MAHIYPRECKNLIDFHENARSRVNPPSSLGLNLRTPTSGSEDSSLIFFVFPSKCHVQFVATYSSLSLFSPLFDATLEHKSPLLQKLIKELPSLVHPEDGTEGGSSGNIDKPPVAPSGSADTDDSTADAPSSSEQQQHGDHTSETASCDGKNNSAKNSSAPATTRVQGMQRSPGEVAFFKMLHSELRKAIHFFDRAQEEFSIREERVREGMEITKKPNSIMVNGKWSLLAKSLYRLYKDLLLLETYAIMTYCAFSKILKKHDKNTRYNTRSAFMANVVNKANFTHYPKVLAMIARCEAMYEEVSEHLSNEGQEGLCEDERLFINMIHRLNAQVMDTAETEGKESSERKHSLKGTANKMYSPPSPSSSTRSVDEESRRVASSLKSLVEENEKQAAAGNISGEESSTGPALTKRTAGTDILDSAAEVAATKRARIQ